MRIATKILSMLAIILGIFLIADNFFFHALVFKYEVFGVRWLDPYIDHWMWGLLLLLLGYFSLK